MERREFELYEQLQKYVNQDVYPFHMPGHKRAMAPAPSLPYSWDLTEVDGVDDLHHADGILKDAMDQTAKIFHADRTWYLVGGSTCGVLSMIRAAAPMGSEVLVARNCHKSVYHAIELGNLTAHWMIPAKDPYFEICGSITPSQVREGLEKYPKTSAVILTSPTYEGVLSDIEKIAAICHERKIPLLVDEAHGAHLGLFGSEGGKAEESKLDQAFPLRNASGFDFSSPESAISPGTDAVVPGVVDEFPQSAICLGADVVVQSAHKTLPSLTQTGFLHLKSELISAAEIEKQLDIFETSSPSYPLLASLDGCTGILANEGEKLFADWLQHLATFDATMQKLKALRIMCYGADHIEKHVSFFDFDPSKILISAKGYMSGGELAAILQSRFGIVTEMHCGDNVLAMTSCCDTKEGFERLQDALLALDAELSKGTSGDGEEDSDHTGKTISEENSDHAPQAVYTIAEAALMRTRSYFAGEAAGKISAEYVFPYPPGIPVLVPGERITTEALKELEELQKSGSTIIHSGGNDETFCVIED